MHRYLGIALLFSLFCRLSLAADDVASAVAGTVKSVDKGAKTAVVKTSEGTETHLSLRRPNRRTWRGSHRQRSKDAFQDVKEGDNVVVPTQ